MAWRVLYHEELVLRLGPLPPTARSGTEEAMSAPTTMRATVLMAPHRFELQERPVPQPGPEDVLVRVRACGV
jgi:hypothetical protein